MNRGLMTMNNDPSNLNPKKNILRNYQSRNNKSSKSIVWQESNDIYQPTEKPLSYFLVENGITEIDLKLKVKAEALNQLTQGLDQPNINHLEIDRVYIKPEAFNHLKQHLQSNLRVEQGGILFGNTYQDPIFGIYVEITASVPAPATVGTGAHLEFTSDSWLAIMDEAKTKYPNANIVGWYHSHPNIGVFMSGTDMRTQQAFFYHDWSVSIVHDPVKQTTGFFLGKNAIPVNPIVLGTHANPVLTSTQSPQSLPSRTPRSPRSSFKKKGRPLYLLLSLLVTILFIGLLTKLGLNPFPAVNVVTESGTSFEINTEKK